jgi:hypothetical protein
MCIPPGKILGTPLIAYQENDEGRFYTCISTDVLRYLNMKLYQRINVLLYQPINICLYWRIYVCMYRLEYVYQCRRINPTVLGKECKNKMYLES